MNTDWEWLKTTEELQKNYFDNNLRAMQGGERDKHIATNVLAAINELNEALDENPSWKPWANEVGILHRENFKGELVDVLHFMTGCTND